MVVKAVAIGGVNQVTGKVRLICQKNDIPTGFIKKYILVFASSDPELDFSASISNAAAVVCQEPRDIWVKSLRFARKEKWRKWGRRIRHITDAFSKVFWRYILRKSRFETSQTNNIGKIFCLFEDCLENLKEGMVVQIKVMKKQIGELTIILPAGESTKGRENG